MVNEETVLVHNSPKGRAFKFYFNYIKKKFPKGEFMRKYMPRLPWAYKREVNKKFAGLDIHWIDSSPEIAASEELLEEMCKNGLLTRKDKVANKYGDKDIYYSLSKKGRKCKVEFG